MVGRHIAVAVWQHKFGKLALHNQYPRGTRRLGYINFLVVALGRNSADSRHSFGAFIVEFAVGRRLQLAADKRACNH